MRKREGLNRHQFLNDFQLDYEQLFANQLKTLRERLLIEDTDIGIRLSDKGLLFNKGSRVVLESVMGYANQLFTGVVGGGSAD